MPEKQHIGRSRLYQSRQLWALRNDALACAAALESDAWDPAIGVKLGGDLRRAVRVLDNVVEYLDDEITRRVMA